MAKHLVWAVAAVLAIGVMSYATMEADKEDSKQKGFVGEACVKAGGQWKHEWASHYDCVRPDQR